MIETLREQLPIEEFDYNLLMESLKEYRKPRDKVTQLMRDGFITRIKKGIYVFGPKLQKGAYSVPVLANLIYGPSYISMEYALAYHGLIPNRREEVTSMTTERNKEFKTPAGKFIYQHLHQKKYTVGVLHTQIDNNRFCMIASPEKALADLLAKEKELKSTTDIVEYIGHQLRIDLNAFNNLDTARMREIATAYSNPTVTLLAKAMGG
ncbi:MAG: hypothetical protein H7A37_10845 [Chlamydiales bacterium]|nr:hypothetical protein [Chlamydiia bacterium]MCP5508776.1 hypothetical protein [Chlamydiales bacterium]